MTRFTTNPVEFYSFLAIPELPRAAHIRTVDNVQPRPDRQPNITLL